MGGPNGSTILHAPVIRTAAAGWTLAGATDANGDGAPDLVFQNDSSNAVSVWYMGGPQGSVLLSAPVIAAAAAHWTVSAAR